MAKKRTSSVVNTPQRDGRNSKKAKVDQPGSDENNNQRRSTRSSKPIAGDDAILNASNAMNTEESSRTTKRTASNVSKRAKRENGVADHQPDQSADDQVNSAVSIELNGESTKKTDSVDEKSADEKPSSVDEKANSADEEPMDLSEGSLSDGQSSVESDGSKSKNRKNPTEKPPTKSKKASTKSSKKEPKKRTRTETEASDSNVESNLEADRASEEDPNATNCRRSARKRVSQFSLKELLSSGSSEEESDFEEPRKRSRGTKKVSKKQMKAKIRQFIGGSDDEDEYRPNESEQSDDEIEADEIEADEERLSDAGESDVSDVLETKSKYFKKLKGKHQASSSVRRGLVRLQSVKRPSNGVGSNLDRYQANIKPKSGGCSYNSIGIDSLGAPQSDLLKHKIANYKVDPSTVPVSRKPVAAKNTSKNTSTKNTATTSTATSSTAEQPASAFGNGSCVRNLLSSTHITAKYETYKRKHIDRTKNRETVQKEDLLDILKEFETGIANPSSDSNEQAAGSDTDDDDFEEVENAKVGEDFEDYKPECLESGVTIQVKDNLFNPKNKKNSKKNVDWIYDAIRQSVNRMRREIYANATKVAHLASLARAKFLHELTFDEELQSLAYSTDFFTMLKPTKAVNESFVKKFVKKFKDAFQFVYKKERSQLLSSREAICKCFETGQTNHPTVYNLIFLVLFRTYCKLNSIEANSRLCTAFRPIDSKCDTLLSKPKKWQGVEEVILSDDEKPIKKSNAKKSTAAKKGVKAPAKSKSKKKANDESEEEEDEDFSEGESKYFRGKKSSKGSSKASSKSKSKNADPIVEKAMQLNKKNLIELWAEIYLPEESVWYCVEPINEIYSAQPEELEDRLWVKPLYVLSFNCSGHLKDLTAKYVASFYLHKFKRQRLDDDWLTDVYSAYRLTELSGDEFDEDLQIREFHLSKPLPKSNADFKNHGLYYLKKDQLKYEVIYPADSKPVGKFHSEPVYLREHVHETHSREYWKKEARMVREGEEPAKISTARPKWDKNLGDWIRNLPLELYGYWQTEDWDPGEVVDGKVPRNEFGNVDLFKPCMLPRGAAYLRLNGLLRIAQKLEIDCVPAVTGFDLKQASTIPLIDGFVVPKEHEELLTIAWQDEQERIILKQEEKYYARVYGNWKRLVKAFIINSHIKRKYRDGEDDEEPVV